MNVAAALFGESASRVVVSVAPEDVTRGAASARRRRTCRRAVIGQTGGNRLRIAVAGADRDRSVGRRSGARLVDGDRTVISRNAWPEQHVRQIQRRMRRLRHLRPSRSGQHDLPRPLRAAASRAGERRHRRVGRRSRCAISRAMGYVADIFDGDDAVASCPGRSRSATCATRPPARASCSNAQPILIDCAHGQIAHLPQRQPRQRARAARRARAAGLDLPVEQRHRGHPAPLRAVEGAQRRGRHRRVGVAGAGRVLAGDADEGSPDRGPRSARLPAARARPARRRVRRLLGNLRDGPDRRDLRARRRAGRGADHLGRRRAVDQAVSAGAAGALHLRARLFRAARQLRVRPQRQRGPHRARARARARAAGRRRRRRAGSRLRRVRGDGLSPRSRASRCAWA